MPDYVLFYIKKYKKNIFSILKVTRFIILWHIFATEKKYKKHEKNHIYSNAFIADNG